jgi:ribonuclease P protein component
MSEFSFGKAEKLKSQKEISLLFEKGRSVYFYPVKILYLYEPRSTKTENPVKCGVSVSSKKFKRAVDRNFLKRRMREAYRLNKAELINIAIQKNMEVNLFILFLANEKEDFHKIRQGVLSAMKLILEDVSANT